MKIAIIGSANTGKTFLATQLKEELNGIHICGDEIKANMPTNLKYEDFAGFLGKLASIISRQGKCCIVDYMFSTEMSRHRFKPDFIIWMNTNSKSIEEPKNYNIKINTLNYDIKEIKKLIGKRINTYIIT